MHELTILNSGSVNAPVNAGNEAYIAGSASGNIDSTDILIYRYRLIGTVTLTGASSIAYSGAGSPAKNEEYEFNYEASVTPAGNTFSIFGVAVPDELLSSKFIAKCVYDGSAWKVKLLPSFDGVGIVDSDRLAANSVTLAKMAQGTTGSILAYNASGDIEEVDMATDGKLLIGVTAGKGYNAAVLSGDATLSTGGVLSLASGSVDTAELVNASVTTDKIDDGAVTAAKLDSNVKRFSFTVPIDFSSASRLGGTINIPICYNCVIDDLHGTVMDPVLSTCSSIFKDDGGTVMTGSQIDITTGHLLGNVVNSTPSANNVFSAGDVLKIEPSAASTLGGEVLYTICGYLT